MQNSFIQENGYEIYSTFVHEKVMESSIGLNYWAIKVVDSGVFGTWNCGSFALAVDLLLVR